jgi:membrane-bound lytic murein transglycosylase D
MQNLTQEEVDQLQDHSLEVQEQIENPQKEQTPTTQRLWTPPDYASQKNILGYDSTTFQVPEPMKDRVQFWVDIFTKYSTSQGVLHDSRYVHIIYEPVDLSPLDKNHYLTYRQRFKAEQKLIDERKDKIKEILLKLHETKDPSGLTGEELRYWKMFESVEEENKFLEASQKGRLRFQLGQSDRFKKGIFYSGRYLQEMEKIFESYGLPKELTRLPFVESSFNVKARSKVGASGIWQFMRGTGREYMKVNELIDERNDPIEATIAAAKKLRNNYRALNSWPLAVTAYNYGVYGMKRIVEKYQSTELYDYIGKRPSSRFGFASESFYASFLAALEVEKNANKYFGEVVWDDPFTYEKIVLDRSLPVQDLKSFFPNDDLTTYNQHLSSKILKGGVPIPAKTQIKIPVTQKQAFVDYLSSRPKPH